MRIVPEQTAYKELPMSPLRKRTVPFLTFRMTARESRRSMIAAENWKRRGAS
jgi:hypothetical protein